MSIPGITPFEIAQANKGDCGEDARQAMIGALISLLGECSPEVALSVSGKVLTYVQGVNTELINANGRLIACLQGKDPDADWMDLDDVRYVMEARCEMCACKAKIIQELDRMALETVGDYAK